jgi:hypothetical protein
MSKDVVPTPIVEHRRGSSKAPSRAMIQTAKLVQQIAEIDGGAHHPDDEPR